MVEHTKNIFKKIIFSLIGISVVSSFFLVILEISPSSYYMDIGKIDVSVKESKYHFHSTIKFNRKGFYLIGLNIRNGVPLVGCARLFLRKAEKEESISYDFARYFPVECLKLIDDKSHKNLKFVISVSKDVFGLKKRIWKEYRFK